MFMQEQAAHDIHVLNGLVETTLDSIDGYHRAAQECPNRGLRFAFMDRVNERQQVVNRLCERVRQLGAQPEDEGSILAKAHRFFLSIRDRVDADAIIAEIDHGESYLAGRWQSALDDPALSAETRQLVDNCHDLVRRGHDEWRRSQPEPSRTGVVGAAFETAGRVSGMASA